jgi:site-specific DNA-methyltransferase (adenine-specific)/site-specific DNA-methyltransferase (cytosine-N4-specific)
LNIKENVKDGERQTYVLRLIMALKKQGWLWTEEYCWYKKNCHPGKWNNRFRDSWERCLHFTKDRKFKMYQDSVKVPIGDWAKTRFKSMSKKDYIRTISGTNSKFGRNVANWLNKRRVYPHNVLDLEEEHYIEPTTVIHFATTCSNRNHSAAFPLELPSWFMKLFTKKGDTILDPFMGNSGKVSQTKNRRPLKLIYWEGCLNQQDAAKREKYLKTTWGKRYLKGRLKEYLTGQGFEI